MKKMKKTAEKKICLILTALIAVIFMSFPVHAEETGTNEIDPDARGSIHLKINEDEWYVEGTSFALYQVATISRDLTFTDTAAFKKADVDLEPVNMTGDQPATADKWMKASSKLIAWARKNDIPADQVQQMHNRSAVFDHLAPGLYLIQGDTGKEGNRTVTYQPILICIPQRSSASQPWNYSIQAEVKSADPTYVYPTPSPSSRPGNVTAPQASASSQTNVKSTPQPSSSPSASPNTGDSFHAWLYTGVMIAMGFVIGVIIYIRTKERED